MLNINKEFENRKIDNKKLLKYGFKNNDNIYTYEKNTSDNLFKIIISIGKDKTLRIIDLDTGEEYTLAYVKDSKGSFVGKIKEEYAFLIKDIIDKCTTLDMFKEKNTKDIISYIKDKYNDDLEFLWDKFPSFAVIRNKSNNKWYGLIAKIKESNLGIDSEKTIETINLRYEKDKTDEIVNNKHIFPAYHMNKKSWITVVLDKMDINKLKELVDNSYNLVSNKTGLTENEMKIKIYSYMKKIPKGKVVTYKQIAEHLGNKGLARVVGSIMRKGIKDDAPYYKVLNSKGELVKTKYKDIQKEMLLKENIKVENDKVDLNIYKWEKK